MTGIQIPQISRADLLLVRMSLASFSHHRITSYADSVFFIVGMYGINIVAINSFFGN